MSEKSAVEQTPVESAQGSPPRGALETLRALRRHTAARIGLGRVGASMPLAEVLQFALAHARARDAVHVPLDTDALSAQLKAQAFRVLMARSQATDRCTYLLRPDLGRRLDLASAAALAQQAPAPDLAIVVADGLSAPAVQRHAAPLLERLRDRFAAPWRDLPVVLTEQGRVAIGDEIGAALKARLVIVLIGERPGLSSPDSMGIYMTHAPRPGLPDSARNCISNVRAQGLSYDDAALTLAHLAEQALARGLSGIGLKDTRPALR